MYSGLTNKQAYENLKQFGYNELPSAKPKNVWRIAVEIFKEPMFLLLIGCASLYLFLGDYTEGIILLASVLIVIFITFYQHQKTERSLEALKKLSSPRALVVREGSETRIAGREVVPDDLLILNEGDRVPADAVILSSENLSIDESMLTGESIPVVKKESSSSSSDRSKVFSGTLIIQGRAFARVTNTGTSTRFGQIGVSLQSIEQDTTRLQREMTVLIRTLFIISGIISLFVIAAFYFSRGSFLNALLTGLSASMALLPEEFPVVLTVFLALGAWRLSMEKVLTRKPSAIENLGAATVLCSDKTGTITQNKMAMAALYANSTIYSHADIPAHLSSLAVVLSTLYSATSDNSFDPMEKAIEEECNRYKLNRCKGRFMKEFPLSKELFAMTRVYELTSERFVACSKGAPEAIFQLCRLSEDKVTKLLTTVHELADKGFRVLGIAEAIVNSIPDKQTDIHFKFLGLVGFEDPIRPEVPDAIQECNSAGIKVIMITGDFPGTAKSIATQIGLHNSGKVISGAQLQEMSDEELRREIKSVNVFARIVPEQKLQIIRALKSNGEIVAMTGDGVNDAPALKASDIGVAMGYKGTDVAREASSLVLLDDNFASIVKAIRSGRRIYDNLQKAMSYIMAIHVPIIGLVLLPAFITSLPILLMPLHIVFMELIIDPVCSIAFESEQEEENIMTRPPRNPEEKFFGVNKIIVSLFKGTLLLALVLVVYFLSIKEGHTEGEVRAIAFSSLIIGNVFLIITSLSETRGFLAVFTEKNKPVFIFLILALSILFISIRIPFLQSVFNFHFPGYTHFVVSLSAAGLLLIILELLKVAGRNKKMRL